jgi:hypothetical protein
MRIPFIVHAPTLYYFSSRRDFVYRIFRIFTDTTTTTFNTGYAAYFYTKILVKYSRSLYERVRLTKKSW